MGMVSRNKKLTIIMNEQPNKQAENAPRKYHRMQQFFHANMKCSWSVLSFSLISSESNEEGGGMSFVCEARKPNSFSVWGITSAIGLVFWGTV